MEAIQPRYSESDVLRCLEQSAIVLDDILARGQQGNGALSVDEQHAIARNLATISSVLTYLRRHVIPSILADRHAMGLLRQQVAVDMFARISKRARALELHFKVPPATLN